MDRIRAPYNFVPASPRVVWPDWADVPAQDVPFEDGVCGTLTLEIEARTPLFVRGRPEDRFFSLSGGGAAIPGSEIRGLLRNVVEIASFGKLGRVNNHRYAVRDLQNRDLYLQHMAALMVPLSGRGTKEPQPLVDAGWLERVPEGDDQEGEDRVVARITPCDFAKIHYADVSDLARARGLASFSPGGRRQSAAEKYRAWGATGGDESVRKVKVEFRAVRPEEPRFLSRFGKAKPGGSTEGVLVFTGQPQPWRPHDPRNKAKRHDFVFFEPEHWSRPVDVSAREFNDFAFVHADRGQQGRLVDAGVAPNEEWGFWRDVYESGGRVPVFFLRRPDAPERPGALRAFGLAMMFRLAYKHSVHDAVLNAQPDARSARADLADLIFGCVPADAPDTPAAARRGRVSFGLMRVVGEPRFEPVVEMVLGAPKPSFYPNYVEQGPGQGDAPARAESSYRYKTYMDDDVRVRGWKRYRPHEAQRPSPRSAPEQARVTTRFTPIASGTVFRGTVRVHNLRRVELGAVLWALDFGERREKCFHTLGLGRSYGYGRVSLRMAGADLVTNPDGEAADGAALDECRSAFEAYMEGELRSLPGGWRESVQLRDLIALATPIPPGADDGRHMELRHPRFGNEFQAAKKHGLALPPVGRPQGRPGGGWVDGRQAATGRAVRGAQGVDGGVTQRRPGGGAPESVGRAGVPARVWSGLVANARVKARVVGINRKGKWQVELVEHAGRGVVGLGEAPPGVEVGAIVDVIVTGLNPTNLVLRWP